MSDKAVTYSYSGWHETLESKGSKPAPKQQCFSIYKHAARHTHHVKLATSFVLNHNKQPMGFLSRLNRTQPYYSKGYVRRTLEGF